MAPKAHPSLATLVAVLVAAAAFPAATVSGGDPPPGIVGGVCTGQWPPPKSDPPPPASMMVLDSVEYVLPSEGRSIIVEKVEPPPMPVVGPAPPPPVRTPGESEAAEARWSEAARRYRGRNRMVVLSCTVCGHRATLVGRTYRGRQYRAWSNIDFNRIAGIGGFGSGDGSIRHNLLLGLGKLATGRRLGPTGRTVQGPVIPPLPADGPGFVVVEGGRHGHGRAGRHAGHPRALQGRGREARGGLCEERERNRLEREAWPKANPPPPRDTILMHSGIVRPESPAGRRTP